VSVLRRMKGDNTKRRIESDIRRMTATA